MTATSLIFDPAGDRVRRELSKLEAAPVSPDTIRLHSQLLRYLDRYEDEEKLLETADQLGISSDYLDSRKAWHRLPLFDRLVARAPLDLPRDPDQTPAPETLEQLCFVTALGSDQPYFNVGLELLESIRATRSYREIPICILDAGLTDEDRHSLQTRFTNLTIKDPGFDLDVTIPETDFDGIPRPAAGLKGCLARPFIPKHFPGYRYYVWFDTDVWIQDERSVDRFILAAEKYGIGSVVTPNVKTHFRFKDSWWHQKCEQHGLVPRHFLPTLLESPSISAGTFCIDVKSGFFTLWAAAMKEAVEASGQIWGPDEVTYMYARQLHFPDTPVLAFRHNFAPTSYGLPIFDGSCLLTPYSAEPVGIIHFCGMRKDLFFAPLLESSLPVDTDFNKSGKGDRTLRSIHFRDWPWQDKPAILRQLLDHPSPA
jgi:hypothetical protein